jgi:peptide/nickel transport system permease protein
VTNNRSLIHRRRPRPEAPSGVQQDELIAPPNRAIQVGDRALARQTWTRFKRHRLAYGSLLILALLIVAAIFAPIVAGQSPTRLDLYENNAGPSAAHFLGTDSFGRDIWARLVYGARVSLSVGIVAVGIYTVIGMLIGAISGFYGGWIDGFCMRLTDTVMSFPTLTLIILAVALLGPSIYNVMIVIGLLGWPGTARLVRSEFLSLRDREFVVASRMVGARDHQIILRHILPNALYPVIVSSTLGIAGAILTEAGLSFLGLGVQQPTPSWGNMLNEAQKLTVLQRYPWQWIPPGMAIALAVLVINFVGDGLRDALDPRTRSRGSH